MDKTLPALLSFQCLCKDNHTRSLCPLCTDLLLRCVGPRSFSHDHLAVATAGSSVPVPPNHTSGRGEMQRGALPPHAWKSRPPASPGAGAQHGCQVRAACAWASTANPRAIPLLFNILISSFYVIGPKNDPHIPFLAVF